MIFEVAHLLGLVPLLWIAGLSRRRTCGREWWWLAGAFAVSWLADTAAHVVDPWLISMVYPVTQAAIVGAVLLDREEAVTFVVALIAVGIIAVVWRGVETPDVLLHTVAWAGIALVVFDRIALGRLRAALFIAFGLGWLAWVGYTITPGWPAWLAYQGIRALGIVTFCWAASSPGPRLRLA